MTEMSVLAAQEKTPALREIDSAQGIASLLRKPVLYAASDMRVVPALARENR